MRLNPTANSLRLGPSRSVLATVQRRPRLTAITVVCLYGIVGFLTWLSPTASWGPIAPETDYFRDLQTINLALFGAQATLLGLVYPLVIALVGMLFGQRSSSDRRLDVYFSETEAVTVGGLALGLVGNIALQSLSYGQLELRVVGAITALNCLWFSANLWGLGFFVLRSLDFIRPVRRQDLIKSYIANTAFHHQLRDLMMGNQWRGAPGYGHLPKPKGEEVVLVPGLTFAPALITRKFDGQRRLKDIRMGLLYAVLSRRHESDPRLEFPVSQGIVYDKRATLVAGGAGSISWAERLLLNLAFSFGPPLKTLAPPPSETILAEAIGDLVSLVGSGRFDEFKDRLNETIDLHALLYHLAQEPPAEGSFNYAGVEHDMLAHTTIGSEWMRTYLPLLRRVGEPLDADGRFYEACAYFPARLGRRIRETPYEARQVLFNAPFALFRATLTGAARRHLESAETPPAPGCVFSIEGIGSEFYRRNLISFVASWESFGTTGLFLEKEKRSDWPQLTAIVPNLKRHLRDTVLMVALSAKVGESQAIGWMSDLLLKWRSRAQQTLPPGQGGFSLQRPLISLALTERPWDELERLPLSAWDREVTPIGVFDAAVENLWTDSLMVLVTTLIETFGLPEADGRVHNGAGAAAGALFRNQAFDPGAGGHPSSPPLSASSVLGSLLRIAGSGERYEEGYAGELSKLAETIVDMKGPNYVSARIYSWSGSAGFEDQTHSQLLLLAATMQPTGRRRHAVNLNAGLQALLVPDSDRARRRIQSHLRMMRDAAKLVEPTHGRGVIATLLRQDISTKQLDDRLAVAVELLEQCETTIQAARDATIVQTPIDPERLGKFVSEVASLAFSPETASFPVSNFATVESVRKPMAEQMYQLAIDKGVLTEPQLGSVIDNLAEFCGRQLAPVVAAHALAAMVAAGRPTRRRPKSAETYWTALKTAIDDVRGAGQTPVIVRGDRHQPSWLSQWEYGPTSTHVRPADMTINRRDVDNDSYNFDLNGVAVYSSGGIGAATWVFGLEKLERISFQAFDDGGRLDPKFVIDPANPWKGSLLLNFGLEVTSGEGPLWQLTPPKPIP